MRQDDHPITTSLQACTDCHEPFVVPVDVIDVYENGACLVELFCTNCHSSRIGVADDDELTELDARIQASIAVMHNAVDVYEAIDEWERAEAFVEALHADRILPEDF